MSVSSVSEMSDDEWDSSDTGSGGPLGAIMSLGIFFCFWRNSLNMMGKKSDRKKAVDDEHSHVMLHRGSSI